MTRIDFVREYAKQNQINPEEGLYRVWYAPSEADVRLCGKGEQQGFEDISDAYRWARQHVHLPSLVITGPHGMCDEIRDDDRYSNR